MKSRLLESGQVGNIGINHLKQIREATQTKWDSLGFLKGLKGHVKENVAQLYENEATHLINEATSAADNGAGSFETVVFPIVRRVFSKLLANDIVSVQALNLPIGKLFYFIPETSERVDGKHTSTMGDQLPKCVDDSCSAMTKFQAKNLYDAYYNDGLFDQSKGAITINYLTGTAVSLDSNGVFIPLVPVATDIYNEVIMKLTGFGVNLGEAGKLVGPDGVQMDTESFLASLKITNTGAGPIVDADGKVIFNETDKNNIPFRVVTQKYGKGIVSRDGVCDTDGDIYLGLDLTQPITAGSTYQTDNGYVGMSGTAVDTLITAITASTMPVSYATYGTLELETEMGEVSFKLDQVDVSVEERKLRATWSPELAQDVSAFHNINAEAELTAMLSEQVAAEIDREILRDLRKVAAWQVRWNYNGWRTQIGAAHPYTQKDWNQTLITKVNQVSAQIHKTTLRGGANFIVVSSEISAIFDDLEYFHVSDANPEEDEYNMGIEKVGTLQGRYQVYRDPYSPYNSIIIGHKGKSLLDTGYIYAPYVPLQLTPTMYNPFNFAPVKGIMTRYAKKSVNNRFYGGVHVDGVVHFDINELR